MLPNISISKGQPDYEIWSVNTTEVFFLKNHRKRRREPSPRPFSKNPKLTMYLDRQSEILYSLFF